MGTSDLRYSTSEEIAHAISHGVGALFAMVALPLLVVAAAGQSVGAVVGSTIFGVALMLLFLFSTLYHALPPGRAKRFFHSLDHAAIYLLIAGTYTPFMLTSLRGAWGWSLLAVIWSLAAFGVGMKLFGALRHRGVSIGLYLTMGWLVVIAIEPLSQRLSTQGLAWLVAGGVFYTLGVPFYAAKRHRWTHFAWHLFVLAGSACHVAAVITDVV